jgi:hypothetical protein
MRLILSVMASAAVVAWAVADLAQNQGVIFMRQPLSSKHKMMERDCSQCHPPWRNVTSSVCKNCHKREKHIKDAAKGDERDCLECHREHMGVRTSLTAVSDVRCLECHNKEPGAVWSHKRKLAPARVGVLLTHKVHFDRGIALENLCKVCHPPGTFRLRADSARPVKDVMYKHVVGMKLRCPQCHGAVKTEGFSASGGGLDPAKCSGCHEKRFVSVSCGYCHKFHHVSPAEMIKAPLEAPLLG